MGSTEWVIVISMILSGFIVNYMIKTSHKPYRAKDIGMTWLFIGAGLTLVIGKLFGTL